MRALTGPARAWLTQRPPARLVAAWAFAVAGPAVVTLALLPFRSSLSLGGFFFCMLAAVLAAAALGGSRPALTSVALGAAAGASFYDGSALRIGTDLVSLIAFVAIGAALAVLVGELAQLAGEQASSRQVETALRRVATLVARAAPADELFAAVTAEVGQLLAADYTRLGRYEPDDTLAIVATWSRTGDPVPVGSGRWSLAGDNIGSSVRRTGRPARMDDFAGAAGPQAAEVRKAGVRSAVGAPVLVDGRIWGVMTAGSLLKWEPPPDTEARLASFTDLLATAIANAENLAQLTASRARVVATADETRRRIERDLHDGAQQRLVSLGLALRVAQTDVPAELGSLAEELARVADGLGSVHEDLREMARGIHPAILAQGGLGPALKTLARRSAIPVELDVKAGDRLPERVEVAAYYVVAEALTNAAKYANASVVEVAAEEAGGVLRLRVRDDGDGGADPAGGTGLVGLKDRVEAAGGTIAIHSPAGAGTTLDVRLPLGG